MCSTSHYPAAPVSERVEQRTLSVIVDNEPGVLARVIGLFSGRGYNIDSLTVSETEHEKHLSRITIVTRGTPMVLEQIKNQLERLVPIHRVIDMTVSGPHLTRELAMVKVRGKGEDARVTIRSIRRKAMEELHRIVRDGEAGEDEVARAEKELQATTDRYVHQVDDLVKHKESELLEV